MARFGWIFLNSAKGAFMKQITSPKFHVPTWEEVQEEVKFFKDKFTNIFLHWEKGVFAMNSLSEAAVIILRYIYYKVLHIYYIHTTSNNT